jgi:hypothetical protein
MFTNETLAGVRCGGEAAMYFMILPNLTVPRHASSGRTVPDLICLIWPHLALPQQADP